MNLMRMFARDFSENSLVFAACRTALDGVDGVVGMGWEIGRATTAAVEAAVDLTVATGYFGGTLIVEGIRLPRRIRDWTEESEEWWNFVSFLEVAFGNAPPVPEFFDTRPWPQS